MIDIKDRISIQVGLSGYSFSIKTDSGQHNSGWMGADTVFVTPQLQKRYSDVAVSVFTPYCTLVPENFYRPELSRQMLSDVVNLPSDAVVECVSVPRFAAVMPSVLPTKRPSSTVIFVPVAVAV